MNDILTPDVIRKVLHHFTTAEPEVRFDLHESLRVILVAAEAHADLIERVGSDETAQMLVKRLVAAGVSALSARSNHDDDALLRFINEGAAVSADRILAAIKGEQP
jgi:hypothetical protein